MKAILHNIRSLQNVGSMFRTADAAGVERLYLTGITPAPVDEWGRARPQLTKVSLGAEETVSWKKYASATRLIKELKKQGHCVIAVEQHKKAVSIFPCHGRSCMVPYKGTKTRKRLEKSVLVVGNEVRGLSSAVLALADHIVEIPMRGKKESLNVAVAFGIAAYWFLFLFPIAHENCLCCFH